MFGRLCAWRHVAARVTFIITTHAQTLNVRFTASIMDFGLFSFRNVCVKEMGFSSRKTNTFELMCVRNTLTYIEGWSLIASHVYLRHRHPRYNALQTFFKLNSAEPFSCARRSTTTLSCRMAWVHVRLFVSAFNFNNKYKHIATLCLRDATYVIFVD